MTKQPEETTGHAAPPAFLLTKEYRRFAEFCDACRRHRYIGLCYGPPGVGKTLSARYYAQWDIVEQHLYAYFRVPRKALTSCRTLMYTPAITTTARRLAKEIEALHLRVNCLVEQALSVHEEIEGDGVREYC